MYENASFEWHHHSAWKSEGGEKHRNNSIEATRSNLSEPPDMTKGKTNLKDQEETNSFPLEDAVLGRKATIGGNLSKEEETEVIETLSKNKDIFAWSAFDLK